MTFPHDPHERSPKGDHNRRLALGLEPEQFAAEAGVSTRASDPVRRERRESMVRRLSVGWRPGWGKRGDTFVVRAAPDLNCRDTINGPCPERRSFGPF